MFNLEHQLKILPKDPGVYIMKNDLGEVIYVGKAKVLKNRVKQYFQNSKNHSTKVRAMVQNVSEFDYIITDSELEALILECNLIKKYKPRYNILLKDDKQYPMIKITVDEDFPRFFVTRRIFKDKAKYFGPYTDVAAVYEIVNTIKELFPIRNCRMTIKEGVTDVRPCLNYYIKKCCAPCAQKISKAEYNKYIEEILNILSGKDTGLLKELKKNMEEASIELNFEKAAIFRDKIIAYNKVLEKQRIMTGRFEDEDFISYAKDDKDTIIQVFFLREGKVNGREHFMIEGGASEDAEQLLTEFIKEFYGKTAFIPKSIYVESAEDIDLVQQWLSIKKEAKVEVKIPQKGEKLKLLNLVKSNAEVTLRDFKSKIIGDREKVVLGLQGIKDALSLDEIPNRIEAYDISNIQGTDSVGGMIVFEDGRAKNSDYRRFKIKTVVGPNDYESMREVLRRRFKRGFDELQKLSNLEVSFEKTKFTIFPDLICMDGGIAHVNLAREILSEFNLQIPVCGMVKNDSHTVRGLIYNGEEIEFKPSSPEMMIIRKLSDEVHRFAITYHRSLRDKKSLKSILEDIPGIGEKRRKNLLLKFGGIDNIKKASFDEVLSTPSMDRNSTESLIGYFKDKFTSK